MNARQFAALAIVLVSTACGDPAPVDGGPDTDAGRDAETTVSDFTLERGEARAATIGASGGSVTSADGFFVLEIPPGALDADTEITVTQLDGALGFYELTPDGLAFAVPARGTLRVTADALATLSRGEPERVSPFLLLSSDGTFEPTIDALTVFAEDGSVEVTIDVPHFSVLSTLIGYAPKIEVSAYPESDPRPLERMVLQPFVHDVFVEAPHAVELYAHSDVNPSDPGVVLDARVVSTTIEELSAPGAPHLLALERLGPEVLDPAPTELDLLDRAEAFTGFYCPGVAPEARFTIQLRYSHVLEPRFIIVGDEDALVARPVPTGTSSTIQYRDETQARHLVACRAPTRPNVAAIVRGPTPFNFLDADSIGISPGVACTDRSDGSDCQVPRAEERVRVVFGLPMNLSPTAATRIDTELDCAMEDVYCGSSGPIAPGLHYLLMYWTEAVLELEDPGANYQLGLPLDADGIASNNLMPTPSFPADTYAHTDLWAEIVRVGGESPVFQVRDAREDFSVVPSRGRALVRGGEVAVLLPADEVDVLPRFRGTAFRYLGDSPLEGPFSASLYPGLESALHALAARIEVTE